ncbi:MAG: hypothetical protein Wins2KO_23380 [Winogradskyella sp.]
MLVKRIIYWVFTGILCGIMLFSATMYFSKTEMVKGFFEDFNFPTYIVIPLAVLKVLGVFIVLFRPSKWLTEWVYAGFFFNLVLATAAHHHAGDGILGGSLLALITVFPSYFLGKYLRD